MRRRFPAKRESVIALTLVALALAAMIYAGWGGAEKTAASPRRAAGPQLVSMAPLAAMEGEMCQWVPASATTTLAATLMQAAPAASSSGAYTAVDADRAPVRVIRDTFPTYSAIAVDAKANEVFLQDENLFGIRVFGRLENTPPNVSFTEPKRLLGGHKTKLEFNCGLYIDPQTGDVYSINNDTTNDLVIFPHDAQGNVEPARELRTPHGSFGIAVDEGKQELYLTVEHEHAVVVYRKMAEGNEKPLRRLEGVGTLLADPHGIALDPKNNRMFVSNHGSTNNKQAVGSGKFLGPSITVYPLDASGETAPLRVIQGPKTQLNWPMAMAMDSERGEFYVANDTGDSILVFRVSDNGDAAPLRIIKGPSTSIKNPTGIFLDSKNDEIWVANMGNHRALVFPRAANGDVAPLRTIRSAPADKVALAIGNPGAVAYDSKREEVLVPNWVAHPQIAAFPRLAKENSKPARLLAGQKTLLARTMHDIRYDAIHDEIVVTNPFAQAILVFRGGANGEEAPIRVIQGPHTLLTGSITAGVDRVEIDPVNNEILIPGSDKILVYPREGSGDIAPTRILQGPDTQLRGAGSVAVDNVHDRIVVGGNIPYAGRPNGTTGGLILFDRTASGNVKPLGMIGGPKSEIIRINQLQVYSPKGWIVAAQPGTADEQEPEGIYVGIWNVNDRGDLPPRWKIGGPKSTLKKPRGVVLNPKNKELIVADMRLNSVLTYSFPELF